MRQAALFSALATPEGFAYTEELIGASEEQALLHDIGQLEFRPFEFFGYRGNRRVVSFGYRYDYNDRQLRSSAPIPDFLQPLRARAAQFAALSVDSLQQVLINEYRVGAGIGWHRDKPVFEQVVAVSLQSACRLRFRLRDKERWRRWAVVLQPRSAYRLCGAARSQWEHSIAAASELRYSVTFRNLSPLPVSGPQR